MKIKNILILAIFTTMILFSCQEKELLIDQASSESTLQNDYPLITFARVVEGRLVFENKEKFDEAIDILFNNQDKLDGFENQFPGFISAQMAFDEFINQLNEVFILEELQGNEEMDENHFLKLVESKSFVQIVEEDGELFMEEVVHCSLLSKVLNADRIVQIGQSVFKFTPSQTLEYDVADLISGQILSAEIQPVQAYINYREILETTKQGLYGVTSCYKNYASRYRRVRGRIESSNSFLSGVKLGFSTTSYRRPCRGSLCIWTRRSVYEIGLFANGTWSSRERDPEVTPEWTYMGPFDFDVIAWKNNSSKIEYYVHSGPWLPNFDYQVFFNNYSSNHNLRRNQNSEFQECFLLK